jgi:hypothetical protein
MKLIDQAILKLSRNNDHHCAHNDISHSLVKPESFEGPGCSTFV